MANRTETVKRIAYKTAQRDAAVQALDELLKEGTVESYSFGDGNGTQSTKRRKISEYQEMISELEKDIDELEKNMQGGGLRTFSTNRYG
jgi:molybdenum-dependent DNA-binding transcriptional regulator ModE